MVAAGGTGLIVDVEEMNLRQELLNHSCIDYETVSATQHFSMATGFDNPPFGGRLRSPMKETMSTTNSVLLDRKLGRHHPYESEGAKKNGEDLSESRKLKSCFGGSTFSASEAGFEPGFKRRLSSADVNIAAPGPGAAGNLNADDASPPFMDI